MARTICRRAERRVFPLITDGSVDAEVGRFINRLSDFLFASARYAAQFENKPEEKWQKRETKSGATPVKIQ